MDLIYIITLIVQIILLIIFLVMAANVGRIKQLLIDAKEAGLKQNPQLDQARINYYKNKSRGNNNEAVLNLYEIVLWQLVDKSLSPSDLKKRYDALKAKYDPEFNKLGIAFPEYFWE